MPAPPTPDDGSSGTRRETGRRTFSESLLVRGRPHLAEAEVYSDVPLREQRLST